MIEKDRVLAGFGMNSATNLDSLFDDNKLEREEFYKLQKIQRVYSTMPHLDPDNNYTIHNGGVEKDQENVEFYKSVIPFLRTHVSQERSQSPEKEKNENKHMKVELFDVFTSERREFEVDQDKIDKEMEEEMKNSKALQLGKNLGSNR